MDAFAGLLWSAAASLLATLIWDLLSHYVPWLGGVRAGKVRH